jgi:hypothetical protein
MMLAAARSIAHKLTDEELGVESVLPRIERIRWRVLPVIRSNLDACMHAQALGFALLGLPGALV